MTTATIQQQQRLIDILGDRKVKIQADAIYFYKSRMTTLEFLQSDWEAWDEEQRYQAISDAITDLDWDDAWSDDGEMQIDGYTDETEE